MCLTHFIYHLWAWSVFYPAVGDGRFLQHVAEFIPDYTAITCQNTVFFVITPHAPFSAVSILIRLISCSD